MKKLTVKELLTDEKYKPLQFFLDRPYEFINFMDYKEADILCIKVEEYMKEVGNPDNPDNSIDSYKQLREPLMKSAYLRHLIAKFEYEELIKIQKKIDVDKLMAYLATIAKESVYEMGGAGKGNYTYYDGEYIEYNRGIVQSSGKNYNEQTGMYLTDKSEESERLVKAVLLANQYFMQNPNKKIKENLRELANDTGKVKNTSYVISSEEIKKFARDGVMLYLIRPQSLQQFIDAKLISRNNVLNWIARDAKYGNNASEYVYSIKEPIALYLAEGIITESEIKSAYKMSVKEFLRFEDIPKTTKIIFYIKGKINIHELEEVVQTSESQPLDQANILSVIDYLQGNVDKIAELLIHNVLTFDEGNSFLTMLVNTGTISQEQRESIEQIRRDFSVKELSNYAQVATFEKYNISDEKISHRLGIAIDPKLRTEYLKSIGNIKEIAIKARENEDGKVNSLGGYELFIIPSKGVAILEKLYETKQTKQGQIEYKLSKEGKLIPAKDNATYVLPIEMAREMAESRNKKELIQSPYVHRAFHIANWVPTLERAIQRTNPKAQFQEPNTSKWQEAIANNYKENREREEKE